MGRAERRKAERRDRLEERKGKVLVTREQLSESRKRLIDQANTLSTEYLMTCFALSLHRLHGFEPDKILMTLQCVDNMMGQILSGEKTMDDFINELDDTVGLAIRVED